MDSLLVYVPICLATLFAHFTEILNGEIELYKNGTIYTEVIDVDLNKREMKDLIVIYEAYCDIENGIDASEVDEKMKQLGYSCDRVGAYWKFLDSNRIMDNYKKSIPFKLQKVGNNTYIKSSICTEVLYSIMNAYTPCFFGYNHLFSERDLTKPYTHIGLDL